MKLFGFEFGNKSKKEETKNIEAPKGKFPIITEADKTWLEENFQWLMTACGLPKENSRQILFTKDFFPKSFSSESLSIPLLIEDLSDLLNLDSSKIDFELQKGLIDIYGMPYADDDISNSEIEITENGYKIHIPNDLTKRPNSLLFSVLQEFIKIRLIENKLHYDNGEEYNDADLFIYLAGIYFGFGVIFCQNLVGGGYSTDGMWETKWNYVSAMPKEVMAYGLAIYCGLIEEENFDWKGELHPSIKVQFEKAMEFLEKNPSSLLNKVEIKAIRLIEKSNQEYDKNKFDFAISLSNEALLLTNNDLTKATIYNGLGYSQLRNGDFEESIINFEKALEIEPNFGFANDNLAYSFIKLGKLEKAKHYLEEAIATENNDLAYHYRNVALYYEAKREIEKAEEYFKLAFEEANYPIDLLELDYSNFLLNQGKTEEGIKYLNEAVKKGEPEAIQRSKELEND